ncbi:MAG: undecaprenyl-phosphate glucose phosphotransferase [Candidatus Auribacterota bacterium]
MINAIKKHEHTIFSAVLTAMDFLSIVLCFISAYYIRFYTFFEVPKGIHGIGAYLKIVVPVALLYVIIFERLGIYKPKVDPFHLGEIYSLIKGVVIGSLIVMSGTYMYRQFEYSRGVMLIAFMMIVVTLIIEKVVIRSIQANLRSRGFLLRKVLIVGIGNQAQHYYKIITRKPALGYKAVGFLTLSKDGAPKEFQYKDCILGTTEDIASVIKNKGIDEVVVGLPSEEREKIIDIILLCEKAIVKFRILPDIVEILISKMTIEEIEGIPFVGIKETPLLSWWYFVKRWFDIIASGAGLIMISPLFLVIALIIKKTSPGPIFYKQERMGLDGKVFTMYKFRTMAVNAEAQTGPVWAKPDDDRRTGIGAFLRKANLDELPQLFNVLHGDMSLVGPRPERPYFVDKFKDNIPHYMSRHRVKSGMTGWAQVNGLRGNTSLEERIKYDLYYIENWSLLLDIKIILMTFIARKNAY